MPQKEFTVQKYASGVGTKEPFTAAFLGLMDLLNAAQFDAAKQTEIKNIIMEIYTDCLLPGFLAFLRKIHKRVSGLENYFGMFIGIGYATKWPSSAGN